MPYYSKQWSSATPGYLLFLIDQSDSMRNLWFKEVSYAQFTAHVVNLTINELIASNASGDKIKDRVFISLIGYGGNGINDLRSEYLSSYSEFPIRIRHSSEQVFDGEGRLLTFNESMPIFLEEAHSGYTPMGTAFELAKKLVLGWIEKKPNHPVPVIINISDGYPEGPDAIESEKERRKTVLIANEIMNIHTSDGPPLIFNVHISGTGKEIQFPQNEYELEGDPHAELLFKISSEVPETYKRAAKKLKLKRIGENSKGFISNAKETSFIEFINFGSSGSTFI